MILSKKILVIIVTYNAMKWAEKCLSSLSESKAKVDVFIVDNGSTDGTQNFIKTYFRQFKFIQSPENIGFGAANNLGFRYALDNGYDYVYLLNQDAWIYPDTIDILVQASTNSHQYGILSPIQLSGDGVHLDKGFENVFVKSFRHKEEQIVKVPFVMAAHWFIPISVIKKVGGFSPTFFHYGEDNNFIDRIHYHGYEVGVALDSRGVHDRYERPISMEKHFYLKDTSNLIRLSDPNHRFIKNFLYAVFFALAFTFKSMNLHPIKGMRKHCKNLTTIRNNRKLSQSFAPFL